MPEPGKHDRHLSGYGSSSWAGSLAAGQLGYIGSSGLRVFSAALENFAFTLPPVPRVFGLPRLTLLDCPPHRRDTYLPPRGGTRLTCFHIQNFAVFQNPQVTAPSRADRPRRLDQSPRIDQIPTRGSGGPTQSPTGNFLHIFGVLTQTLH